METELNSPYKRWTGNGPFLFHANLIIVHNPHISNIIALQNIGETRNADEDVLEVR